MCLIKGRTHPALSPRQAPSWTGQSKLPSKQLVVCAAREVLPSKPAEGEHLAIAQGAQNPSSP